MPLHATAVNGHKSLKDIVVQPFNKRTLRHYAGRDLILFSYMCNGYWELILMSARRMRVINLYIVSVTRII